MEKTHSPEKLPPIKNPRFTALDESRALAIFGMILFHYGSGTFKRLPSSLMFLTDPVLFIGRFATPAFITVFGITAGFVYFSTFQTGRTDFIVRIYQRAWMVLAGAVVITIPEWINLWLHRDLSLNAWIFSLYSVLNFYALAFFTLPLWLRVTKKNPVRDCWILGVLMWLIGLGLNVVWTQNPEWKISLGSVLVEYLRMNLISGPYAYFQMAGFALWIIPLGFLLKRAMKQVNLRRRFVQLVALGTVVALLGGSAGVLFNELTVRKVVDGAVKAPPHMWYFLFFGGFALVMVGLLALAQPWMHRHMSRAMYVLALIGQSALFIYVGQGFVLPALGWLDAIVNIEGFWRIILPLVVFVAFCSVVVLHRHRLVQGKSATAG